MGMHVPTNPLNALPCGRVEFLRALAFTFWIKGSGLCALDFVCLEDSLHSALQVNGAERFVGDEQRGSAMQGT